IIVPQKATYEMQDRRMVYVVTDSSTLKSTLIDVKGVTGDNYVVDGDLKLGDVILLEGLDYVKDGDKIEPKL
ncbi:MAG: efflux RND transporter periplasmic adaptor subunit, partial [Mucinivorans sp.]